MTAFLFGLAGAIVGNIIGGYLSYHGGIQGAQEIEKNKINQARIKIIYQLHYILNAIKICNLEQEIFTGTFYLINVADFTDDESEKITRFFQIWKDIQFDASKSQLNNSNLVRNLMNKVMDPLVEDIEMIIQKYQ